MTAKPDSNAASPDRIVTDRTALVDNGFGPEWMVLELLAGRHAPPDEPDLLPRLLRSPELRLGELLEQAMRQKLVYRLAAYLESNAITVGDAAIRESLGTLLRANLYRTILLRDVANVRDGEAVSTNVARLNGQEAVMVSILKLGRLDHAHGDLKSLGNLQCLRQFASRQTGRIRDHGQGPVPQHLPGDARQ